MNELNKNFRKLIEECYQNIDQRGELPSNYRKKIYEIFEQLSAKKQKYSSYYYRAKLELACARKTLDKWANFLPTNNSAQELLEFTEKFLEDQLEQKKLQKSNDNFYTEINKLLYERGLQYTVPAAAGLACVSAANAVLYGIDIDNFEILEMEDPDNWTACFNASIAYSGGPTWQKEIISDDLKRKEFWIWFLKQALPTIWEL